MCDNEYNHTQFVPMAPGYLALYERKILAPFPQSGLVTEQIYLPVLGAITDSNHKTHLAALDAEDDEITNVRDVSFMTYVDTLYVGPELLIKMQKLAWENGDNTITASTFEEVYSSVK